MVSGRLDLGDPARSVSGDGVCRSGSCAGCGGREAALRSDFLGSRADDAPRRRLGRLAAGRRHYDRRVATAESRDAAFGCDLGEYREGSDAFA